MPRCLTRIERHQTALRGRVSVTFRWSDCHCKQRRLRNLSVPTQRSLKIERLDPRRVAASRWRIRGESRPRRSWFQLESRIGLVSARLVRRAASVARVVWGDSTTLVLVRVDLVIHRSPARGPIQTQRGRACAAARRRRSSRKGSLVKRGRRECPSSAVQLPRPGRVVAVTIVAGLRRPRSSRLWSTHHGPFIGSLHRRVTSTHRDRLIHCRRPAPLFIFARGFAFASAYPFRKCFRSNGTCLRHK